jgi:tRNA1(Val) A37 N6-methylase TrmN6
MKEDGWRTMGKPKGESIKTTRDSFFEGKIVFLQPEKGYRAAIDPVFLAASVNAKPGDSVLDVGAGVGAAALCLAARVSGLKICGIEIMPELVALANANAKENGFDGDMTFVSGDLLSPPDIPGAGAFHHVIANPPFLEQGKGRPSPDPVRATSNIEGQAGLKDWIAFCASMVRNKGSLTMIHRADRLDGMLAAMAGRFGDIVVFPLWPEPFKGPGKGAKSAKRIIVSARKGVASPMRLSWGMVIHQQDGSYTKDAEEVLRHGAGIDLIG